MVLFVVVFVALFDVIHTEIVQSHANPFDSQPHNREPHKQGHTVNIFTNLNDALGSPGPTEAGYRVFARLLQAQRLFIQSIQVRGEAPSVSLAAQCRCTGEAVSSLCKEGAPPGTSCGYFSTHLVDIASDEAYAIDTLYALGGHGTAVEWFLVDTDVGQFDIEITYLTDVTCKASGFVCLDVRVGSFESVFADTPSCVANRCRVLSGNQVSLRECTTAQCVHDSSSSEGEDDDEQASLAVRIVGGVCVVLLAACLAVCALYWFSLRYTEGTSTEPSELYSPYIRRTCNDTESRKYVNDILVNIPTASAAEMRENIRNKDAVTCCVCLETVDKAEPTNPQDIESSEPPKSWAILACAHGIHYECLHEWITNRIHQGEDLSCPVCRQQVCAWFPSFSTCTLL